MQDWRSELREPFRDRATEIGLSMQAFWRSQLPPYMAWMVHANVLPAIAMRQVAFSFAGSDQVLAVAAWACVTGRTREALLRDPYRQLELFEWNDGDEPWIMALLGQKGQTALLLRNLVRGPLKFAPVIRGYHRATDGTARLRVWNRGNGN